MKSRRHALLLIYLLASLLSSGVQCWQSPSLSTGVRLPTSASPPQVGCRLRYSARNPICDRHNHQKHPHRSSVGPLYSSFKEPREVDLGIFGVKSSSPSPPPPQPTEKSRQRRRRQRDNKSNKEGINGSSENSNNSEKSPGFVRGILQRIRGKDRKDDDNDDTQADENGNRSNNNKNRQKRIRQSTVVASKTMVSRTRSVEPGGVFRRRKRDTAQQEQLQIATRQQATRDAAVAAAALARKQQKQQEKQQNEERKRQKRLEKKKEKADNSNDNAKRKKRDKTANDETNNGSKKHGKNGNSPFAVVQKLLQNGGDSLMRRDAEQWVTVFPKTRISPGELVPVTVQGIDLLVIASNDGKNRLYCTANACPHLGTPLELGQLVRLPVEDAPAAAAPSNGTSATQQQQQQSWTELQVSSILQQDGCEDCIVCPLHKTAFALESGQVRGEWCPYPPVLGPMVGSVKKPTAAAVFGVRVRGKDVQVRINTPLSGRKENHHNEKPSSKNDENREKD